MDPRFDLLAPPFEQCQEKLHYWHRGVLRGALCRNAHEYVLKQRDWRQGLPHFRHLLWPKLGPILPLLLEQLQNSKCILSLRVSLLHNKNHFFLQDVDFVSPPAPTSSAGDGQRGFRLEYRQIPCSTWVVKIGIVKARFPAVRDLSSLALSKSTLPPQKFSHKLSRVRRAFDLMWRYSRRVWVGSQRRFNKKQCINYRLFIHDLNLIVMATKLVQEWILVL